MKKILFMNPENSEAYYYDTKTSEVYYIPGDKYKQYLQKTNRKTWLWVVNGIILFQLSRTVRLNSPEILFIISGLLGVLLALGINRYFTKTIAESMFENTGITLETIKHLKLQTKNIKRIGKAMKFFTCTVLFMIMVTVIFFFTSQREYLSYQFLIASTTAMITFYVFLGARQKRKAINELIKNSNNNQVANKVKKLFITTILLFSFFLLIAIIENKIFGANIPILLKYINLIYIIVSISYLIYQVVKVISSIFKKKKENKNDQ